MNISNRHGRGRPAANHRGAPYALPLSLYHTGSFTFVLMLMVHQRWRHAVCPANDALFPHARRAGAATVKGLDLTTQNHGPRLGAATVLSQNLLDISPGASRRATSNGARGSHTVVLELNSAATRSRVVISLLELVGASTVG